MVQMANFSYLDSIKPLISTLNFYIQGNNSEYLLDYSEMIYATSLPRSPLAFGNKWDTEEVFASQ